MMSENRENMFKNDVGCRGGCKKRQTVSRLIEKKN